MARVPPLPEEAANAAAADAGVPAYMAELRVFQVLLRNPQVARAINDLLAVLLFKGSLDPRLRELIIMRIGWVTGSVYEWTQHWRIATGLGVDPDDLIAVRDWRARAWSGPEAAVLEATDATLAGNRISDAVWAELGAIGSESTLIEIVTAIGLWQMVSGVLRSLDVSLEDGVAPWPPDGAPPGG